MRFGPSRTAFSPQCLLLALVGVAALAAPGCQRRTVFQGDALPVGYALFLFAERLESCPKAGTQLRHIASAESLSIEAGYWGGPYCHGFTKYDLYDGLKGTEPVYARLDFGANCSLFIAIPAPRLCVGVPLSACSSYQAALAQARAFATLALPGAKTDARTLNTTGFDNPEAFEGWCARRIREKYDSTAAPEFQIAPTTSRPQNVD